MLKKVTSFDVAKLAGVAQPTVSRALRDLPGASDETRERVKAAAEELGYIPNASGRALSTNKSRRIAVVSEQLTNPFYPELVEPLSKYLAKAGFRSVVITHEIHEDLEAEIFADGSFDGVILTTTHRYSSLPGDLTKLGIPHVLVNRILDEPESPSCAADNNAGALAVSALIAGLGHTKVGSIQGLEVTSTGRERATAIELGMKIRGIDLKPDKIRRVTFGHDSGRAAAIEILTQTDPITAIACGNDVIALGVLSAAKQLGYRVPEDLTVIGFDDITLASWPLANLTTVRCDLEALAQSAVNLLLTEIQTPHANQPPVVERIPVNLILRGTHGPPR